ncbi:MAG: hypothetical protein LIP03_11025 [Bacteroidales bacterium]|nr:hypothetical protein [Bacteroidales bacterium]
MIKSILAGLMAIMALCPLAAAPLTPDEERLESMKHNHVIIYAGEGNANPDSVAEMIELFYVDQFRSFQDPTSPTFMLMSKDARLAMGIGGMVRMRAWADYDGAVPANAFLPSLIPVPEDPYQRKDFKGTPAGTGLFMRIIGRNIKGYNIGAYIFGQFSGYENVGFKLKQAYVTVNDWTIGYAPTTFSDVEAEPPMIDGGGANGSTNITAMLVRWLHAFNSRWSMAASAELPKVQLGVDNIKTRSLSPWLPDVAAYGQISFGHGAHLRLGAILRMLSYHDLVKDKNQDALGWGAQLSGIFNVTPMLQAYFTANGGQGYSSHTGDLVVGNYDLIPDPDQDGKMYAPWSAAAWVGLKYFFNKQVFTSASVGQLRYYPRSGVDGTEYKYGRYFNINLYYQPTDRLQAGVEWIIGDRHNFNHLHASAHRFDFLFQFAF